MIGLLVIFAAHSGAGKSTIIHRLLKKFPDWEFSISYTTRKARQHEKDGVDYYFADDETFNSMIRNQALVEFEEVHGNYYGTPIEPIKNAMESGKVFILDLDVYGAVNVKKLFNDNCISIFINVSEMEELENRLVKRGTENLKTIQKRLERIPRESKMKHFFDYVVDNDNLEFAIEKTEKIILKNKA